MAFSENLIEGLASAAGATDAVGRIEQKKQRRQALSDAELEAQTHQILGDVSALQERRAKLDPNSPTYQQDLKTIDQALHDARGVFTDLYHPQNNPNALQKFGGFLKTHLGRQKQPSTPAAAKQSMADRIAGIESAAYAPTPGYLTEDEKKKAAKIQAGLEPRAGVEKPEAENWVPQNVTLSDGREITLQRNSKAGRWTYLDGSPVEPELLKGATAKPKGADKPPSSAALTLESYESAFDPPVKWANMTPEQRAFFPRWKAMQTAAQTTGQSVMMIPQPNGSIMPVTVQKTSEKTFPGTQAPPGFRQPATPTTPRTPAQAKSRITPPQGAGVIGKGEAVGGRLTPAQTTAQKKYQEAVGLVTAADEVAQHPNDAINQKRLAVRLERLSAGRFTTQALDYVIKAGWGNTLQQWANNVTTGALPPDVMRQLVDGAHQYLDESKAEMKASGLNTPEGQDQDIDDIVNALKGKKK